MPTELFFSCASGLKQLPFICLLAGLAHLASPLCGQGLHRHLLPSVWQVFLDFFKEICFRVKLPLSWEKQESSSLPIRVYLVCHGKCFELPEWMPWGIKPDGVVVFLSLQTS